MFAKVVTTKRKKNNNNTLIQNEITTSLYETKINNVNTNRNNGTLNMGFFNCSKTYLMNYILLHKQEPIFVFTNSLKPYPNIKAQTSDDIQTLEIYENSTVVFDDMLLLKHETNIDLFFTRR